MKIAPKENLKKESTIRLAKKDKIIGEETIQKLKEYTPQYTDTSRVVILPKAHDIATTFYFSTSSLGWPSITGGLQLQGGLLFFNHQFSVFLGL